MEKIEDDHGGGFQAFISSRSAFKLNHGGNWLHGTNPFVVLMKSPKKVFHPVAERLKCGRSQLAPNVGELTIKKRPRDFIQFTAHSNFAGKSLGRRTTDSVFNERSKDNEG